MAGNSKIEWTESTWNPVTGCSKVSQGCKNCYAERLAPKVFAGQRERVILKSTIFRIVGESVQKAVRHAVPADDVPSDADKYQVLRTTGICDGQLHFRITDEMDAAIGKALAAAGAFKP